MESNAKLIMDYAEQMASGRNLPLIANELFAEHNKNLGEEYSQAWRGYALTEALEEARRTLKEWEEESGREQNYTPTELVEADLHLKVRQMYEHEHAASLLETTALHDAIVRYAVKEYLSDKLIEKGKAGDKLAVVELSARLAPALTFPGSSGYLAGLILPYGQEIRDGLGEEHEGSLVSRDAVVESALNIMKRFNVRRILAETSSAPTNRIPRSKRKPELYVCEVIAGKAPDVTHYTIDVPFREEYDAMTRELMFSHLKEMYEK